MRREDGKEAANMEDEKEKSERKRQREKERRTALTGACEDLSALVSRLDKSEGEDVGEADGMARKKSRRLSARDNGEDTGGMTRVDLINRALVIMKRLHQENNELKQSLSRGGKNEVMVMVPTLTPADDTVPPPAAAGSFRPPYMQPTYPPGPPQEHSPYGSGQSPRHPPPPGAWGAYPGNSNHYAGRPPQMDHHHDPRPPPSHR